MLLLALRYGHDTWRYAAFDMLRAVAIIFAADFRLMLFDAATR